MKRYLYLISNAYFLNNSIYARKGIAFISHFSQVPIVPVICVRTGWFSRKLYFLDPIVPSKNENRENYSQVTTQKLYTILEQYLKEYPEQWESWMYIFKSLKIEDNTALNLTTSNKIIKQNKNKLQFILNSKKYALMEFGDKNFLFEKENFKIHNISSQFYEVLSHFKTPALISELKLSDFSVTDNAIEELIQMEIIIDNTLQ